MMTEPLSNDDRPNSAGMGILLSVEEFHQYMDGVIQQMISNHLLTEDQLQPREGEVRTRPEPLSQPDTPGGRPMDEQEWLTSTDPEAMLGWLGCTLLRPDHLGGRSSRLRSAFRKVRLFVCAMCRIRLEYPAHPFNRFVEVAERYADGESTDRERDGACMQSFGEVTRPLHSYVCGDFHYSLWPDDTILDGAVRMLNNAGRTFANDCVAAYLLREIFGNPFSLPMASIWQDWELSVLEWRYWRGGLIQQMAVDIYQQRTWNDLLILADALEDAGCRVRSVLDHCRGVGMAAPPGLHARGCWVIDLLLGK